MATHEPDDRLELFGGAGTSAERASPNRGAQIRTQSRDGRHTVRVVSREHHLTWCVLLPADDSQIGVVDHRDLSHAGVAQLVGGTLGLALLGVGVALWTNDNAKMLGLPVNHGATHFLAAFMPGSRVYDVVHGDVVVSGLDDAGEPSDVPVDCLTILANWLPAPQDTARSAGHSNAPGAGE